MHCELCYCTGPAWNKQLRAGVFKPGSNRSHHTSSAAGREHERTVRQLRGLWQHFPSYGWYWLYENSGIAAGRNVSCPIQAVAVHGC